VTLRTIEAFIEHPDLMEVCSPSSREGAGG